jgi:shikimate kinase
MGSGKTTAGKKLAVRLNFSFIDLDLLIEKKEKRTISTIFSVEGELNFRKIERRVLKEIVKTDNIVVACGGGTPCYSDNMLFMKEKGQTVYLEMPVGALINRLRNSYGERPLIKGKSKEELRNYISSTLAEREKYYQKAHYTVNALNLKVDSILNFFI